MQERKAGPKKEISTPFPDGGILTRIHSFAGMGAQSIYALNNGHFLCVFDDNSIGKIDIHAAKILLRTKPLFPKNKLCRLLILPTGYLLAFNGIEHTQVLKQDTLGLVRILNYSFSKIESLLDGRLVASIKNRKAEYPHSKVRHPTHKFFETFYTMDMHDLKPQPTMLSYDSHAHAFWSVHSEGCIALTQPNSPHLAIKRLRGFIFTDEGNINLQFQKKANQSASAYFFKVFAEYQLMVIKTTESTIVVNLRNNHAIAKQMVSVSLEWKECLFLPTHNALLFLAKKPFSFNTKTFAFNGGDIGLDKALHGAISSRSCDVALITENDTFVTARPTIHVLNILRPILTNTALSFINQVLPPEVADLVADYYTSLEDKPCLQLANHYARFAYASLPAPPIPLKPTKLHESDKKPSI